MGSLTAPATRRGALLAAALLALLAAQLAGPAAAQLPTDLRLVVELPDDALALDAGNATALTATVRNEGAVGGTVALQAVVLDGWSVEVEPSTPFSLDGGEAVEVTLTLRAPAAGEGAASGDVGLAATLTDAAGRAASAQDAVAVARVDPPVVLPPPWYAQPLWQALVAALVLALAAGALLWLRRRRLAALAAAAAAEREARETGVSLALASGPFRFGAGRELVYRIAVQNVSERPRVALVLVAGAPDGWTAAVSLPKMALSPGERVEVSVYARPGDGVPVGDKGVLHLAAKPEEAREREERVAIEVEAPTVRVPTNGEYVRSALQRGVLRR